MKFLILLCSMSFLGGAAFAQSLNVVSTYPADGAFGVDTDSVVITFDQKFDPGFFAGDSSGAGVFFFLSPEDSVVYTNFALSEDSLSITYYIELSENTDYTGFIVEAVSKNGFYLEDPVIFRFTTASSAGQFTVEGSLPEPMLEKILTDHTYEDIIVTLNSNPIDFGSEDDDCVDEECEDDGLETLYVTFVNKETGEFSISGVREGTYYPIAFNFFGEGLDDDEEGEFFVPELYFYDPNDDFFPDSISVNSTSAPSDTLSGIDLRAFEIIPITFSQAVERAETILSELPNSPVLVGGATFYGSLSFIDEEEEHEDSTAFKPVKMKGMSALARPSIFAEADDHGSEDEFIDILTDPSGFQLQWTLYGYDSVKDSAFSILVSPFFSEFAGYIGEEEAELPDTVSFSDIEPLPVTYIDSDSAATIIEENGGWEFREYFGDEEFGGWNLQLQALNNFWDVREDSLIENLPVMWSGYYDGFIYDPFTNEYEEGYLVVYLDMETGEVLYTDSFIGGFGEESLITLSEAVELAQPFVEEMDNDPVIIGGGTIWASAGLFEDDFSDPEPSGSNVKFSESINRLIAEHDDHDGHDDDDDLSFPFLSEPNGLQIQWDVYGYDSVKDSAFILTVSEFAVEFGGYIGEEDAELPDSVSFSDIQPLPEFFLDSDSVAMLVEYNGGFEFRSLFSGEYSFWEMELEAVDNFWELNEDTLIIDPPVTWRAEYYGFGFDPFTNEFIEGYFVMYISFENGEIIYSDSEIHGESFTSHITFNEAVSIADSVINDFPNEVDIMGGLTHYTNVEILFKGAKSKVPESVKSKVVSAMDDHGPTPAGTVQPDGHAFSWQVFVYDSDVDTVYIINVTEFDAYVDGAMGSDDVEEEVVFSDMMPLPFTHIDSDSAAALIDAEGALAFRTAMQESELDWYWESDLQLMHQYWDFPPNPTSTAPITWRAEYYAWAFDEETEEFHEDSLTVFLDAETGDVLYSTVIVSNDEEPGTPDRFSLAQNYPNPFNPSTNIPFELREASRVEISVYSILGQKVATIVNELYPAGSHLINWNASDLASGVYIYRMEAGGFTQTRKFVLLK